jgi:hypothetical protein
MLEISQLILQDFYGYLEHFITLQPPNGHLLRNQEIRDEYENFLFNSKLLSETSIFIKSCHEVYSSLTKQIDDLIIPKKEFNKLLQFLSRLRFNMSYLLHSMKNLLKNHKNDLIKYDSVMKLNQIFHPEINLYNTEEKEKKELQIQLEKKKLEGFNFNQFIRNLFIKMKKSSDKEINNNLYLLNEERMKVSRLRYILEK